MIRKMMSAKACWGLFLALSFLPFSNAWGTVTVADSLVGALFGTAYLTSFNVKEVDFYVGQILYDRTPTGFGYFDTYSTTFGTDITIYTQGYFNWFVGTERLGRTGAESLGTRNLQWNIPAEALYSGFRFDSPESVPWQPYVFCIGGLYSMSDLLGVDSLVITGTSGPLTYTNSTYNLSGTTLGLEFGLGFTPITIDNVQLSLEGNYRFANFSNISYSPASSSLPALPAGLPNSVDYSGWSIAADISFEPTLGGKDDSVAAREKLFTGNIPFDRKTFNGAVTNCDPYLVDLFLKAGLKVKQEDLQSMLNNGKLCEEIEKVWFNYAAEKCDAKAVKSFLDSGYEPKLEDLKSLNDNPKIKPDIKILIQPVLQKEEEEKNKSAESPSK